MEALEYVFGSATIVGTGIGWFAVSKFFWRTRRIEEKRADVASKALFAVEKLCTFLKDMASGGPYVIRMTVEERWAQLETIEPAFNDAWDEVKAIIRNDAANRAMMELNRKKNILLRAQQDLRDYKAKHNNETDDTLFDPAYGDRIRGEITALQMAAEDVLGPIARHEKPKREPRFTEDEVVGAIGWLLLVAVITYKYLTER